MSAWAAGPWAEVSRPDHWGRFTYVVRIGPRGLQAFRYNVPLPQ